MTARVSGQTASGRSMSSAVELAARAHFGLSTWGRKPELTTTRAKAKFAAGSAGSSMRTHGVADACHVWSGGELVATAVQWHCGAISWAPVPKAGGIDCAGCSQRLQRTRIGGLFAAQLSPAVA